MNRTVCVTTAPACVTVRSAVDGGNNDSTGRIGICDTGVYGGADRSLAACAPAYPDTSAVLEAARALLRERVAAPGVAA